MKPLMHILMLLAATFCLWCGRPQYTSLPTATPTADTGFCMPDEALPPAQISRIITYAIQCPTVSTQQHSVFSIYGYNARLWRTHCLARRLQAAAATVLALPPYEIAFPFVVFQ